MREEASKIKNDAHVFRFSRHHLQQGNAATLLLVHLIMLTACGGGESGGGSSDGDAGNTSSAVDATPTTMQFAVTATAAPDFASGATSVINVATPRVSRNNLKPTISDLAIDCHGRHFYRIERFQGDNVTKFDVMAPEQVVYQFSTQAPSDTAPSNPYQMVFMNADKAYLLRYGSTKAWIVDPSAQTESNFKVGELDLSAYADADGVPEMAAGAVVDGKLFIVMQRFELFQTLQTAYVAVFDTVTDQEIDTGKATNNLKGIPLSIKNPLNIGYLAENDRIYVQATGKSEFGSSPAEYTGGIETINPDDYNTQLVLDDGDENDHPFGQILNMALVTQSQAYFIGSTAFQTNSLYRFNPTTGAIFSDVNGPVAVAGLFDSNLTSLAVDRNANLWVGNGDLAAPGMVVIDTADDSVEEALIGTNLNPVETCFCEI